MALRLLKGVPRRTTRGGESGTGRVQGGEGVDALWEHAPTRSPLAPRLAGAARAAPLCRSIGAPLCARHQPLSIKATRPAHADTSEHR